MDLSSITPLFEAQKQFFRKNETRAYQHRIASLSRLKKTLQKYEKDIVLCLHKDLKKPEVETLVGEFYFLLDEIRWAQKNLKSWMKPQKVKTPLMLWNHKSYEIPSPLGVVLIISPWNYPFRLLLSPLIGALAAGNCALLKPSEKAPHSSKLLQTIISEAFHPHHVSVITGGVKESEELLQKPFDHIFFTGSKAIGRLVLQASLTHLTPVTLELGGSNPVFVHKDCHLDSTVLRIAWSKFLNNGQTCLAPNFVFVHKDILDPFLEKLKSILTSWLKEKQKTSLSCIIDEAHWNTLNHYLENHNIYYGGQKDKKTLFIEPTLILNPPFDSPLVKEEIFGPLLSILEYKDFQSTLEQVKTLPPPLASYLFTKNKQIQRKFLTELQCGGVAINDAVLQAQNFHLPFGGVKESGWGNYHGKHSFDSFSHRKALMTTNSFYDFDIRFPPYTEKKLELLKKFYKIYSKWFLFFSKK